MPVSETLARSTWFRNSSRNSTSPQLAHDVGTQQGTLCLAPACASLALSCAAPLQPSSLHFHLTSPHVRPPPCLCCPVFEDHLALAHRPPPAINALPSHPYPAATVRYARPRLKHHPQSQERHVCSCLCPCACVSVCAWASSVRRSRDHCMASHGIASRPIASQPHPIAAHQLQLQLSIRACVISCLLCCVASPGPNSTCSRIAATCPLELPLPLTCGLLLSNLLQVCYRAEVFDSAQPFCANGTPNSIGGSSAERQRLCPIRCVSGMWALPRTGKQACLACPVHRPDAHPQQTAEGVLSVLDVRLFRPEQLDQEAQLRAALAADPSWWVLPTCSHNRDLADGWEWRQPLPSDRFASASLSWFVLPWLRVNAESPPLTTPEDPSVRLVWDLPQSVRPQTLLQDNPSLESGRPSLVSFGSFVHPRAPSRCCPCIAHAAGKSIPPSPQSDTLLSPSFSVLEVSLLPSLHSLFPPFLSSPGLASVTFFTPFPALFGRLPFHSPSCPRDETID